MNDKIMHHSDDPEDLRDWLLSQHDSFGRGTLFFDAFARQLILRGVPADRMTLHMRQLNPGLRARSFHWSRDSGGAIEVKRGHGVEKHEDYIHSPVRDIFEGGDTNKVIERRLDRHKDPKDYPILSELKQQGYVHYLMLPVPLWILGPAALSIATRHTDGFSQRHLDILESSLKAFGTALELQETRRLARTLLDTYVGHDAGERILRGSILRGDSEAVHAVLFYCDLRNFTPLSESKPLPHVIELLDRYFETVGKCLTDAGGEILKFIGDGILAIFPCPEGHTYHCTACKQALGAAQAAQAAMAKRRKEEDDFDLTCGIALHVGDVRFGNVGTTDRLDFTVIGPAVNMVTRIEPFSKKTKDRIVVSADFAERESDVNYRSLGKFPLKGIGDWKEILTTESASAAD